MRHRPESIRLIAFFYVCVAIGTLTQAFANDSFSLFRMAFAIGALVVAAGVWSVRPWGYYSFLAFSVITNLYQFFKFVKGSESTDYVSFSLSAAATAGIAFFIQRHVAAPYFNPKIRWWETAPRVQAGIPGELQGNAGYEQVTIVDMSRTGCLISSETPYPLGELLFLKISYFGFQIFVMTKIVRKCDDSVRGYGLMFLDLTGEDRMILKRILAYAAERAVTKEIQESTPEENAQAV